MNKKRLLPLLVLAGAAAVAVLLVLSKPQPSADAYQTPLPSVRVLTVQAVSEHLIIHTQGTVQPRSESQLIPEVSGKVVWMSPALVAGGSFAAGEALLRIDSADYNNAVEKAQAALTRAQVEQEHAADELRRARKLLQQKLASQAQIDDLDRRFRVAEANLSEARINLQQTQRDLSRTQLTAPYQGLVRSEKVDLGQFVARGNAIATIYATDYMEVRLPLASGQLRYVDIALNGQLPNEPAPVTISGELGGTQFIWSGELVRTEREFDTSSRMVYGVARIENNTSADIPTLAVGLFVTAEIEGRLVENIVRLPRSVLRDGDQVLVVDADNRLRFRQIKVYRIEHDEVLISAGLTDGERVSVSPLQTVVDGMRVQPIEM